MPIGAALMNGIVASVVIVLAPILPNQDLFWAFFSLNVVLFLLSYIPVFPAFISLEKLIPIHHVRLKLTENRDFKSFSGFANDYDYYFTDFHSSAFRF